MSTPYGISTSIGSMSYNNYVNTPINGPLSTNQYPLAMPYHSYGFLNGIQPTPPQFYPSQEPPYATENTNARHQYLRATAYSKIILDAQKAIAKESTPNTLYNYSTGHAVPVSTHVNYIAPVSSSMYLSTKKSIAVGKSGYKVGLPVEVPLTTKKDRKSVV